MSVHVEEEGLGQLALDTVALENPLGNLQGAHTGYRGEKEKWSESGPGRSGEGGGGKKEEGQETQTQEETR